VERVEKKAGKCRRHRRMYFLRLAGHVEQVRRILVAGGGELGGCLILPLRKQRCEDAPPVARSRSASASSCCATLRSVSPSSSCAGQSVAALPGSCWARSAATSSPPRQPERAESRRYRRA
jgi:hypothetical protein